MRGSLYGVIGMCRSFPWILISTAVAACVLATASVSAAPLTKTQPVVLELFTSQGCASCPDANRLVAKLAERPDVLALTYAVDYWDYLGWTDTLAKPEFTARQKTYADLLNKGEMYTPEVVVMGREDAPGFDLSKMEEAVARAHKARKRKPGPIVKLDPKAHRVWVGSGRASQADVWLVRYDPGLRQIKVTAGENAGKTLVHHNTVTMITRLGTWTGQPVRFALPREKAAGLAVLVQDKDGGAILSAVTN